MTDPDDVKLTAGIYIDGSCPGVDDSEDRAEVAFDGRRCLRIVDVPTTDAAGEEGRMPMRDGEAVRALRNEPEGDAGRPLLAGVRVCARGKGEAALCWSIAWTGSLGAFMVAADFTDRRSLRSERAGC